LRYNPTDEEKLLSAIQSHPEDAATRLIYADWLEEHGDPRAEFLRLEIEQERLHARWCALRQGLGPDWLAAVSSQQLRYASAYHLHCKLSLRSGRRITLEALDQVMTYAGLLVGVPNREANDRFIEDALRAAERHCVGEARPHLIPPPRRDYFCEPGDMEHLRAEFPDRAPEWLPLVRCIGSFLDVVQARDKSKDISVLVVVWFQDEYALPIREPALSQIRDLDWESLAADIDLY
jgi:uncharacterized protein (TIGR02996 family)